MFRALFFVVAMLAGAVTSRAQFTWSATAGSGNFGTAGNWVGGVAPTSPASLTFSSWTTVVPLDLSSPFTAMSLSFGPGAPNYSLGSSNGSALSLGAGGVAVSAGSHTLGPTLGLTLLAAQNWTVNSATLLTVSGGITGAFGITKTGSGSLVLGGASTFTGGLTMDGGSLVVASSSTAVVSGAGVVTSVTHGPVGTGMLTFNQDMWLTPAGNITLHNAITLGNDVVLTLELGSDSLTLAGVISGSGSAHIHKEYGNGTLTLSGLNTFPGGLDYMDDGTLILGTSSTGTVVNGVVTAVTSGPVGTGALRFYYSDNTLGVSNAVTTLHNAIELGDESGIAIDSGSGSLTLAGVITGGYINKIGAGTLTLNGANTFYGSNTVTAGTLLLGRSSAVEDNEGWQVVSGPIGTGKLYLETGTTLAPATGTGTITLHNAVILDGNATIGLVGSTDQLRFDTKPGLDSGLRSSTYTTTLTVQGGVLTLASDPNPDYYNYSDSNLDAIVVNNGAAVVFAFESALPETSVSVAAGGYAGVADGVLNSTPVGFLASADSLVAKVTPSNFAGTFGFDSENVATPATYSGTLDFSAFANASFAGVGTLTGARLGTGATIFAPNSGPNAGKLAFSGLNGGTLQVETALLAAHNFTGVIIGRDDGRGDAGKVALSSSSNNYTGGTTLKSGTLIVRDPAALGTGSLTATNAATVPVSSADAPKLTTTLAAGTPLNLTLSNPLVVNTSYASGAYGLGIGGADDFTLSGVVSGAGVIDKFGPGTVTLTGSNTFSGKVNVLGGTLSLGAGGTSGSLNGNITNNATLAFNRSDDLTYASVVSGTGSLLKQGSGTLVLTGANTYPGGTTISEGTLSIGAGGTTGSIAGNVVNSGALKFNRADAVTFAGNISGTGGLNKLGAGTLTLSGTNTYSGSTYLQGGTLSISSATQIGSASSITLDGGTLRTTGASNLTLLNNFYLGSGHGTIRNDLSGGSALTLSGNIDLSGYFLTFSGPGPTFAASINYVADLIVDGGNLTLSQANNTYDGPTFLRNAGTLATGANNALPTGTRTALVLDDTGTGGSTFALGGFNNSVASLAGASTSLVTLGSGTLTVGTTTGSTTFAGVISGPGGSLVKDGASTQVLSGPNTYTGGTTVNAGTLSLLNTLGSATGTGLITVGAAGTLSVGNGGSSGGIAGDIANSGALIVNRSDSSLYPGNISGSGTFAITGTGTVSLGGNVSQSGGITINGGALVVGDGATNGSLTGTVTNNAVLAFYRSNSATFSSNISGPGLVAQFGGGTLTLSGTNTYTGGTSFTAGTILVGADSALGQSSGGLAFDGGTLKFASGFATSRPITLAAGGGTISTNAFSATLSGVIAGSGSLTHQGTGILTLSGTNTYSGGTTVQGGGVLDFSANLNLGAAVGAVTLNGGFLRTQAAIADFTHGISLGASGGNFNTNGFNSTVSGQITGTGPLTIQSGVGVGKLTLTNAGNSFTGATFVDSGILELGVLNALPVTTAVTLSNSATLEVDFNQTVASLAGVSPTTGVTIESAKTFTVSGPASTSFAGLISGAGKLVKDGSSTLTLAGANTYSGGTVIQGGTLSIGGGGTSGSLSGGIVTHATLAFNRSDAVTFSQSVSGTGGLLKLGANTLTLTGANTYAGSTVVSAGTLRLGTVNALPISTQLLIDPGAILDVLNSQTIAGFLAGSGSTSSLQISGGAIFSVAMPVASTTTTFAGSVTGAGIFAVSGVGDDVVHLTGSVTNSGGAIIGPGATLVIGTGGAITGPIATTGVLGFGNTGTQSLSNVISGSGGVSSTAGTTILTGANLYTGPTNVTGGRLLVNNLSGSGTGTGTVTVAGGGIFGGTGTITGPLVLNGGGTVAPGASPGILNVGATTFAGNAHFAFDINNATGTVGGNWDLLSISGALTIAANSGTPFVIDLKSLDSGNNAGLVPNFSSSGTYSWQFVTTTGGITGFAANAFTVNPGQFLNNTGVGFFFVSQSGNSLALNFTPIPEPSTYALLIVGIGLIVIRARRRRSHG